MTRMVKNIQGILSAYKSELWNLDRGVERSSLHRCPLSDGNGTSTIRERSGKEEKERHTYHQKAHNLQARVLSNNYHVNSERSSTTSSTSRQATRSLGFEQYFAKHP